jgi:hypothetical protein
VGEICPKHDATNDDRRPRRAMSDFSRKPLDASDDLDDINDIAETRFHRAR